MNENNEKNQNPAQEPETQDDSTPRNAGQARPRSAPRHIRPSGKKPSIFAPRSAHEEPRPAKPVRESKPENPDGTQKPEKPEKTDKPQITPEEPKETEKQPKAAEKKRAAAPKRKRGVGKGAKTAAITVTMIAVIAAVLAIAAAVGGYFVTKSDTIFKNVMVGGNDVGELTVAEAQAKLEELDWDKKVGGTLMVELPLDIDSKIDICKSGAQLTSVTGAEAAYRYGHTGSWIENLFLYGKSFLFPTDVNSFERTLDDEYIMQTLETGAEKFAKKTADTGYKVDAENGFVTVMKGAGELKIDTDALLVQVKAALLAGDDSVKYTLPETAVTMPDFQKIKETIYSEKVEAYFDAETLSIMPDTIGVDLDVSQAQAVWSAAGLAEQVEIPLIVTKPELSAAMLQELLFRDLLGSQTTSYRGSTSNRINNINLVAEKLNGLILLPGDTFSYNGYVGERTAEAGFRSAAAYNEGVVVQEIGGGICQVSSTLYCASMLANLETVDRTCHYFGVGYLPAGLDATVSWKSPDFKFKNNRDYPVKLVAYCDKDNYKLTIEIWGTNLDGSYVELESGQWAFYDEVYTSTAVGCKAVSYRLIYDKDGNLMDKVLEDYSMYHYHDEDIKWPQEKLDKDKADAEAASGTQPETSGEETGT